jgi:hypothetical protein
MPSFDQAIVDLTEASGTRNDLRVHAGGPIAEIVACTEHFLSGRKPS